MDHFRSCLSHWEIRKGLEEPEGEHPGKPRKCLLTKTRKVTHIGARTWESPCPLLGYKGRKIFEPLEIRGSYQQFYIYQGPPL